MDSLYNAYKSGKLDIAIKLKAVKPSVLIYLEIYDTYAKYRDAGYNYTQAVTLTSEQVAAAEITVKRAIAAVI